MAIEEASEATAAADADATLVSALRIAADRSHPDEAARNSAWNTIIELWSSGATVELIRVLASAQVNPRAFLAELLCQIWTSYLGDNPAVLGTYEAEHPHPEPHAPVEPFSVIQCLLQSGCIHPNEAAIKASRSHPERPWLHLLRPPPVDKWSDLLSASGAEADVVARTDETVANVVREAVGRGKDLDWVVAQAILRAPHGVAGLGQSAEARAYLFCHIASAYCTAPGGVLAFVPSPRARTLFAQFMDLPLHVGLNYQLMLQEQMREILGNVRPPSPAEPPQDGEATLRPACCMAAPVPAFWLFLVHWASQAPMDTADRIFDMCAPSFPSAWSAYRDVTVPLAIAAGDTHPAQTIPLPVLTPMLWILMGYSRASADSYNVPPRPVRDFEWLLYVRVADMDALMRPHADSLLGKAWTETRVTVLRVVAATLVATNPTKYVESLESVLERTLDLYTYEEIVSRSDSISYYKLWLRFIALCGKFTKAFETVMLEHATLDQARHVFSSIIKLLNPYPTDANTDLLALQQLYSDAAYTSAEDLPPHLLDRFLGVATAFARQRPALAQALRDGGVRVLLQAVQAARYPYPAAADGAPPHVRAMLRARMVEQAYAVLEERVDLAARAQRVRDPPLPLEEGALPPVPRVAQPRVRRRPSWMATGG